MMDNPDCSALMLGAESQADGTCSAISLEEVVIVPRRWPKRAGVSGVASRWRNSAKSSCARAHGTLSQARNGRPVLMKLISIPTLSPERIRKRGSEATAAGSGAPERCASWQSIADYVVRGVRGDPRGRKSGAGLEATNPR